MSEDAKREYVNLFPCLYEGNITCSECKKYDDCDMRAGRELGENKFLTGWGRAVEIMSVAKNDECEVSTYSSRFCKKGTKGCVLRHGE